MDFEWDEAKNENNIAKHGIGFATAARIFEEPVLSSEDDRTDYGEKRLRSIGRIARTLVVVVVHTDRDGRTRIISARKANRKERQRYDEAIRTGTVG